MALHLSTKNRTFTLPATLHPLTEKNFGLLWAGAFLSNIGFWIQSVGQGWQVLQLTNSALLLGLVAFAATAPNVVLSLFGGAISDRVNRRHLLICTQSLYMVIAFTLGLFTTLHIITVWQIILLALINGTVGSISMPTWQAFVSDLVKPAELKQGIALNSVQFNLSRVIGPAIGGFSVAIFGIAGSYYMNAFSYIAVIIPLIVIRPQLCKRTSGQHGIWRGVMEGLQYARRRPSLQLTLLLQFMIAFLVLPYTTLLPVFAGNIFHIGAAGLGLLNASAGIGALLGSILVVIMSQRMEHGPKPLMILCIAGGGACIFFAFAHLLDLALLLLVIVGACCVMSSTITNTTVQTTVPAEMRGRVLSLWILTAIGLAPFGNLSAGWIAQTIGAPATLGIAGLLCAGIASLIMVLHYRQGRTKFATTGA